MGNGLRASVDKFNELQNLDAAAPLRKSGYARNGSVSVITAFAPVAGTQSARRVGVAGVEDERGQIELYSVDDRQQLFSSSGSNTLQGRRSTTHGSTTGYER